MNKTGRTQLKRLMMLAMAIMMIFSMAVPAMAAPGPISGNPASPAQAVITKELQVSNGTVIPAMTFTFTFDKKSVDGTATTNAADASNTLMPSIPSKNAVFAAGATGTVDSPSAGITTIKKDTASLFTGITWPHAGVYIYTVKETSGTYTTAAGETMTYSSGAYDVAVYVANDGGNLYVAGIGSTIAVIDHPGQTVGAKTDPSTASTEVTGAYSAMTFTNKFVKGSGGTDPLVPGDRTLAISKDVAGAYADKTKYFSYNVTITKSALGTATSYKSSCPATRHRWTTTPATFRIIRNGSSSRCTPTRASLRPALRSVMGSTR